MGKHNFRVAVNVMFVRDSKVLLMRRANTGWNDGMYALMGGHVEDGENVFDAAIRESQEELGLDVKHENLKPLFSMQVYPDHIYYYFGCDEFNGEPTNAELDQCDDVRFFDVNELPSNIIEADKKAIEAVFGKSHKEQTAFSVFGW